MTARSPGERRTRVLSVITAVLGVLALTWAIVTGYLVVDFAHIVSYLPPRVEGGPAIRVEHVHRPALLMLAVSLCAGVLALVGVVVGIRGFVRGIPTWAPAIPVAALLLATAAPFLAISVAGTAGVG